jgi:hypothetical protein
VAGGVDDRTGNAVGGTGIHCSGSRHDGRPRRVRREVQALGDGIERTLARAVELETLVQTEVNQLERSLHREPEPDPPTCGRAGGANVKAVVTHAERVRSSITGAHEALREELGAAGDAISRSDRRRVDVTDHVDHTIG